MIRPPILGSLAALLAMVSFVACSDSKGSALDGGGAADVGVGNLEDGRPVSADVSPESGTDAARSDSPQSEAAADGLLRDSFAELAGDVLVRADGSTDAVACTGPENTAPIVYETVLAEAPPSPQGGALISGLYYETSFLRYNGQATPRDAGAQAGHRLTATIDDYFRLAVSWDDLDTGQPLVQLYQLNKRTPTSVDLVFICPAIPAAPQYGYDATPETLTLYRKDSIGPYAMVLTRQ